MGRDAQHDYNLHSLYFNPKHDFIERIIMDTVKGSPGATQPQQVYTENVALNQQPKLKELDEIFIGKVEWQMPESGNSNLWNAMKRYFVDKPIPNISDFKEQLDTAFFEITGKRIENETGFVRVKPEKENVIYPEHARPLASDARIDSRTISFSAEFWQKFALPLLLTRLENPSATTPEEFAKQ